MPAKAGIQSFFAALVPAFAGTSGSRVHEERIMVSQEQHDRGLALRTEMFGREAVEKRMAAFGEFGKPLQHVVNAYAYGDVWQRSALPLGVKSLAMIAMMA